MKIPVKLVKYKDGYILVSSDTPEKGDTVYTREKGKQMIGEVRTVRSATAFKVVVGDLVYSCFSCVKVMALPEQIGYFEVAPSVFDVLTTERANNILKNGGNCYMEWNLIAIPTMNDKIDEPFILNGKILIYSRK